MGQKVHPGGLRVGVIHDWKSNWYTTNKDFKDALLEDIKIREHINRKLGHAGSCREEAGCGREEDGGKARGSQREGDKGGNRQTS